MKRYLLDTSVYGVLVDENEEDYETVRDIIDYAKKNRRQFVTTCIITKELHSEDISKKIKRITLPAYYNTVSKDSAALEIVYCEKYDISKKLAWNYIQRLRKQEANKSMPDAKIYAWSSIAGIDGFITRNRRGILAENYRSVLRKSNISMRVKFVEIMSPNEFYDSLG